MSPQSLRWSRFLALALWVPFLSGHVVARGADSVVVFNEIHYHPADALNDTEWIEFRNLMGVNVDMSKWKLEGGVNVTFPEGTIIDGHGYLVIAANPAHASLAGTNVLSVPFTGQLANGGESIRLVNNNDRTMDEVSYGDDNDWPVGHPRRRRLNDPQWLARGRSRGRRLSWSHQQRRRHGDRPLPRRDP